jgi:uncharacterized protein YbjQ (UPF0145 family)
LYGGYHRFKVSFVSKITGEKDMAAISGLSGNEIFCLQQQGMHPGDLVIGNSVFSLGLIGGIASGLKTIVGGEVTQVTEIIHEGRQKAYARMLAEAQKHGGVGITGVSNELIQFMAIGTAVKKMPEVSTHSSMLLPQAIIQDKDTFVNTAEGTLKTQLNQTAS